MRDPDFDPRDELDPRECDTCDGPCRSLQAHFPWVARQMREMEARRTS